MVPLELRTRPYEFRAMGGNWRAETIVAITFFLHVYMVLTIDSGLSLCPNKLLRVVFQHLTFEGI